MSWAILLQQDKLPSLGTGAGDYFRVMLVLAAILVLAYAAMRYVMPRMTGAVRAPAGSLKVVARLSLEPRKTLYVLQAGSDFLLIGASESQIHFLTPLDASAVEPSPPPRSGVGNNFERILRGVKPSKGE